MDVNGCVSDETRRVARALLSATGVDGVELGIMIVATFAQAISGQGPALNIVYTLMVWRFIVSISYSSQAYIKVEHEPTSWESASAVTTP